MGRVRVGVKFSNYIVLYMVLMKRQTPSPQIILPIL